MRACVHVGRQVMTDPDLNVACDVLLFKIDVRAGYWGMYNFYKMQVITTLSCMYCIIHSHTFIFENMAHGL